MASRLGSGSRRLWMSSTTEGAEENVYMCTVSGSTHKQTQCFMIERNEVVVTGDALCHDVCHLAAGRQHPHAQLVHDQRLATEEKRTVETAYS